MECTMERRTKIQMLYDACSAVFSHKDLPNFQQIKWLRNILDGVAGVVMDGICNAPCGTSVLFPRSGGNIHSFTALIPCAVLDVLSPPYSEDLGRPSTYFSDFPIPSLHGYAVLEEKDMPQDLVVSGAPYLGPPFVDNGNDHC